MDSANENTVQRLKYPKSIFLIIAAEFCERFSYYGVRAILVIYLNYHLGFSEDTATVIYHAVVMLCSTFPLLGAIVADGYLGRFKTILYFSVIYLIGNIVVSVTSIDQLNLPQREFTSIGLFMIALGTGGIKPNTSTLGGDQFVIPGQELELQRFFSIFYFTINVGSVLSTFVTPILREDIRCFGQDSCFSAAFGLPAALWIISMILFVSGSRWYRIKSPEGNVIVDASKCIWHAATKRCSVKRDHWLDKADDKFDKLFIDDVKAVLRIFILCTPFIFYSSLFDQQGSRWTFQATRMRGNLGGGVVLKPDEMQVLNPILCLIFIPLFEMVIYPFLGKFNLLKRPLQKMAVGGILTALSFVVAAVVELKLEETYTVLPVKGIGQLRLYNTVGCDTSIIVNAEDIPPFQLKNMEKWENLTIPIFEDHRNVSVTWTDCTGLTSSAILTIFNAQATSYLLNQFGEAYQSRNDSIDKTVDGNPKIMTIFSSKVQTDWNVNISFVTSDGKEEHSFKLNKTAGSFQQFTEIAPDSNSSYTIQVNDQEIDDRFELTSGGSYVIMIDETSPNKYETKIHTIIQPNSMNMMWLIPQYVIITAGEILVSVTGLEFAFSQAPASMKALVMSGWLLASAVGNLIMMIVAEAKIFDSQGYIPCSFEVGFFSWLIACGLSATTWIAFLCWGEIYIGISTPFMYSAPTVQYMTQADLSKVYEFLLFASLMTIDMAIFALMAMQYKSVEKLKSNDEE